MKQNIIITHGKKVSYFFHFSGYQKNIMGDLPAFSIRITHLEGVKR